MADKPDFYVFYALSTELRYRVFEAIYDAGGRSLAVKDIVAALGKVTQPSVSQTLVILVEAGLVKPVGEGRRKTYQLANSKVAPALVSLMEAVEDD